MKPSEIKEGQTYSGRSIRLSPTNKRSRAGEFKSRKVTRIYKHPQWKPRLGDHIMVVEWTSPDKQAGGLMYLSSFSSWAEMKG